MNILPWEYRGSGAQTMPGAPVERAIGERAIGGQRRRFTLLMREGVIYFAEPKRAPVWAVTKIFERAVASDELIEAWQREVSRGNFGRYLVYAPHLFWDAMRYDSGAQTALALVHRADYSGWAREWFDAQWRPVPAHRDGKPLDVWGQTFQNATRRAFYHVRSALLDRALPAARQNIDPRWVAGDEAELRRVFELGLRLFVRPDAARARGGKRWPFAAANPVSPGGWGWASGPSYQSDFQISPAWKPLLDLMEQHFIWIGLQWERIEFRAPLAPYVAAQRERWGDDWRGNWRVQTPSLVIEAAPPARLSSHDKLEAILQLRDWLHDKISPRQLQNWLSAALD